MGKDRGAGMLGYAVVVVLIAIIALSAVAIAYSAGEAEAANVPENALNVETYEVGHGTGTIIRWEDPDYDVICWTRRNGKFGGGVSCVPKSQIAPLGPTVIP